ncbi:MAG TPA: hypothetical protein VHR66_01985 [Gemmataceae bacterium]|nr:hypothetical protein [Gemmataceae bacterium]
MPTAKSVAGIVTVYTRHSHADLIVGKILEGPLHDGKNLYDLRLASLYVDQFPDGDKSRALAKKHGFRLCQSIEEALTLGGDRLAVDGVVGVGEHGKYPQNEKGQIQYPRRQFFEQVAKCFARTKTSVPVFSDKHLSASWDDAKWMYDRARELMIPFLAGSSLPLTCRKPDLTLPKNCDLTGAVALGYGPYEAYGFHMLEALQCMVERRKGGETGVAAVTALTGDAMWQACDRGEFSKTLVEEVIRRAPAIAKGDYREITRKNADASVWLIEYRDGFKAAAALLNGLIHEGDGGSFCFAGQIRGEAAPKSCQFYLQQSDPFAHFIELVKAIEKLVTTGHAPYPVERTLLTTGILDAIMTSRQQGGKRIETPHLRIAYQPTDWPHASGAIPKLIER